MAKATGVVLACVERGIVRPLDGLYLDVSGPTTPILICPCQPQAVRDRRANPSQSQGENKHGLPHELTVI